jgi:hypothetical protein
MSRALSTTPVVLPPAGKHVGSVIFLHGMRIKERNYKNERRVKYYYMVFLFILILLGLGDTGHGWTDGMKMVQHYSPHIKFILPHAYAMATFTLSYSSLHYPSLFLMRITKARQPAKKNHDQHG